MRYGALCWVFLTLCLMFAAAGLTQVHADDKGEKQEEKQPEKDENAPLTKKEFDETMEDIQRAWNRLKIQHRNRRAEQAAEQADIIAKSIEKVLRYDGDVLRGANKGQKARDQRDYQRWANDMKQGAEDFARHARRGDWDRAATAREKINESCGNCHDAYEPRD